MNKSRKLSKENGYVVFKREKSDFFRSIGTEYDVCGSMAHAMKVATKYATILDDEKQTLRKPEIFAIEDCISVLNREGDYVLTVFPREDAQPLAIWDSSKRKWIY